MSDTYTHLLQNGRSGLIARMIDLDTVSHNISNIYTSGYKENRNNFQEVMEKYNLNGARSVTTQFFMSQGQVELSEVTTNMAILGNGYFQITLPNGDTAYTRDGNIVVDKDRTLVNGMGYKLKWDGTIPEDYEEISIDADGVVKAKVGEEWQEAGNIQLATFVNPSGLTSYGENLFLESKASGAATVGTPGSGHIGSIKDSALERSNVNIAGEIAHMIRLQKSFQLVARALQQSDTMTSQAISMRTG